MIERSAPPVTESLLATHLRCIGFIFPGAAQRLELLGLGGAALLLTLQPLHELGRYSFWRDEIASVVYASAPPTGTSIRCEGDDHARDAD